MNPGISNNNEYLDHILEIAELGAFQADLNGNCLFVNRKWEKIYGLSSKAALGKGWMAPIVADDIPKIKSNIQDSLIEGRGITAFLYRINHPEKGIRFLKANFKRVTLDGNDCFIGYVQDVSDLKQSETQLKAVNKQLVQSNGDKDRMMKALVHDLKNPIEGICSLTGMMLQEQLEPEEITEMIRLVHDSCSYSTALIKDLVEAILNDHKETVRKKEADLQLLLRQCVRLLQTKIEEKSMKLVLLADTRIMIWIDPEKITRVLYNLISNAIKFSQPGSVIRMHLEVVESVVRLSIHDKGIGIPDQLKGKIFDPFTEAKRYGTANEQPFGLGLSICEQIIRAHRGKIWFDSKQGVGTNFYVELPLR